MGGHADSDGSGGRSPAERLRAAVEQALGATSAKTSAGSARAARTSPARRTARTTDAAPGADA